MTDRLSAQIAFLTEADRLKRVDRASTLTDGSRRENAAEHSWHLALWALVFADRSRALGADPDRVVTLCLLHDLVAVDAGDHPVHFDRDVTGAARAEALAARRIFGLLPPDQGALFLALWEEFEAGQTREARIARQIDQTQPLFQELFTPGFGPVERDILRAILTTGRAGALAADWAEAHGHAEALLGRRAPGSSADFNRRLGFLVEADRLKGVLRGTTLFDGSRRENSGEHSWHLALFALVLGEHATVPARPARVARMLLIHDLVEIDAGDAPIHGDHDAAALAAAETRAARRLFGLLPERDGTALRQLWEEFEAASTPDAIFAKSLDRVQPVLANLNSGGGTWPQYRVTAEQLEARVGAKVRRGAPALWGHLEARIDAWFAGRSS